MVFKARCFFCVYKVNLVLETHWRDLTYVYCFSKKCDKIACRGKKNCWNF